MGYRSKIITFFFLFSGKNGACCYTWGEERAIDSKKRTSCYSLLRFFISPPPQPSKGGIFTFLLAFVAFPQDYP